MATRHYSFPVFLPEAACPFQCIYCNQHSITSQLLMPNPDDVLKEFDRHYATYKPGSFVEMAFFGGNFTGLPQKEILMWLKLAKRLFDEGKIQAIRCSTRPDYIDEGILSILADHGMKTIELGAQSFYDHVLKAAGRGHNADCTRKAALMIKEKGFRLGIQLMAGMPGDEKEFFLRSCSEAHVLQADDVRIYPLLVIDDTTLADIYRKGDYVPLSLDEAIDWTAPALEFFMDKKINVIRVGLHPSEELQSGAFIDGPYHPNFREMVLSHIWKKKLEEALISADNIIISVPEGALNHAVGFKRSNALWLGKKYKTIAFKEDKQLHGNEVRIDRC